MVYYSKILFVEREGIFEKILKRSGKNIFRNPNTFFRSELNFLILYIEKLP